MGCLPVQLFTHFLIRSGSMLKRSFFFTISFLLLFLGVSLFAQNKNQYKNTPFYNAQITLDKHGQSPSAIRFKEGNQPTVASFFQEYQQFFPMSQDNRTETFPVSNDKIGTHHRFNQYYKDLEVIGAQYILHEKNGKVWYANGHLVSGIEMDVIPAISERATLQAALKYINAESYMWEKPENDTFLQREQKDADATFYPKGELKLTSGKEEMVNKNIRLVYRFDIYAQEPLGRYWVDVDAKTGEIVNKLDRIHNTDNSTATGISLYNGIVSMTIDELSPTSFRLREATTRGAPIETYDMQNGTDYSLAVDFTSIAKSGPWDAGGVSGHWGAEATYDYYYNTFGRNSLDNAGYPLLSYVHFWIGYNNAFWDGSRMTYADGDGVNFTPLIGLDVCGHELTHGVTQFSSNLIYFGESGALNESFSDIFGNLVEFDQEGAPSFGTGSWRIGEDITTSNLGIRNMENPNEFSDPDTYKGDYWVSTSGSDNGGVHTNSGVQNFWFYLLSEGGSGTNDNGDAYNVTGIGLEDAAAIAYLNNTSFLIPGSNYLDARRGAIACAEALFGAGSQQAISTADAWDAVGVYYVAPPDNDDINDAIAIACGSTTPGTTIGATFDTDAPDCDDPHTAPGVWYTVEGTGETFIASMCGGPVYDARMTVYEGNPNALVCVGADDDACGFASVSEVTWISTFGTTYYILVHGFGSSTGSFELAFTCVEPPQLDSYDIYKFDIKTQNRERITFIDNADEYNPSFAPGGEKIVHDVVGASIPLGHSLYITDVNTGVSTPLTGGEGGNDASWSPDSMYIAFDRTPAGDQSIYIVPSTGGTPTLVRTSAIDPEWSKNSKRLVFKDISDGSLRTVDLSGGSETTVVSSGANPSWSTNGRYIAYTDGNNIWKIKVLQSGEPQGSPVQLTNDASGFYNQQPSWSKDGKHIVFHSNRLTGDFDIWTMPSSGGTPTLLIGDPGYGDFDPGYQKNGNYVVYASFTDPGSPKKGFNDESLSSNGSALPDNFTLDQNFPNPFNPTTQIRFGIPEAGSVTLKIYNSVGQLVKTLVDENMSEGYHQVTWDATDNSGSKLSSGVYFYRLTAGTFAQVNKMLLLK